MARGELLSVLGLYQYDNTIFDEFVFPSPITKEVLVNNILVDCAELEVVYPNPDILKKAIGYWSQSRLQAWTDMKNVLIVENYRPFVNLQRKESGYDLETRNLKTVGVDSLTSSTSSSNDSSSSSTGSQDLDSTTTGKISAFNSSGFENKDQSIVDSSISTSDTTTSESTDTSSTTSSNNSNVDNTGTVRNEYEHNFEGDSALYSKQSIIEREMEVRLKYDLYRIIIDDFKKKFCLLIY